MRILKSIIKDKLFAQLRQRGFHVQWMSSQQWDHGEFAYSRLKDYLPDSIAWLVRYHAILPSQCEPFMDERDRLYTEKYFKLFNQYDFKTKSPYFIPKINLEKYRDLVEQYFPESILL